MPQTIYFSGSISAGREDAALYRRIVSALEAGGHRVLAGSVISFDIGAAGEPGVPQDIFRRDMNWLKEATVLVAEVSKPSIGVGYEIGTARYRYKIPVFCLWRPAFTARCSAMVAGDEGITTIEYSDEAVPAMISRLLAAIGE